MVFEENFLRLTVTVRFHKKKRKRILQESEFSYPFFRSISLVVTKQIYFSLPNNYLDNVFTLNDLLGLEKKLS